MNRDIDFDLDWGSAIRGHGEWVETRDAVRHPTTHRSAPYNRVLSHPKRRQC